MRERVKNTMVASLKMEFIENDEPTLEVRMPVGHFNCQTMGVLHGGATISLAETAAGIASNLICADDEGCYGMQISANHVRSAHIGDTVIAIATAVHIGRTTHVWEVPITSMNTGKLISLVTVTNFVVKEKCDNCI